jgi:zinc protease
MVGDITRHDAEDRVRKIEDNLSQGEEAPVITSASASKNRGQFHVEFPAEQANVWMGHLGMSHHDPDYYAMRVANDILGGSSITSRLFTRIRGEHGLVYGISSSFQFLEAIGPFLIHFSTQHSTLKKALSLTQSILDNYISKGPTPKEFRLAKQKMNNEFPLSLATDYDIIHYLTKIGFYKLPLDYMNTYQANIAAVTLNEVKAAIKKHIQPDEMIKVIVGSKGSKA